MIATNGVNIHVTTKAVDDERARAPTQAAITHRATMNSGKPIRKPIVFPYCVSFPSKASDFNLGELSEVAVPRGTTP